MREHINLLKKRQRDLVGIKYPDLIRYLRSDEFKSWYKLITGWEFDPELEATPELAVAHIEALRQVNKDLSHG